MPAAAPEAASREPRGRAGRGAPGAPPREKRAQGARAREPPAPGWALSLAGLEAMSPQQRHRHLLFGDLLDDVGAAASIFPRESAELGYGMPDPRLWTQSLEPAAARQDRLLGVLKAAEARGRVRALRLRYTYMRVRAEAAEAGREERGGDGPKGGEGVPCGSGGCGSCGSGGCGGQPLGLRSPARPPRRRRRSRCSSSDRSRRAPPSGWSCSCRRS